MVVTRKIEIFVLEDDNTKRKEHYTFLRNLERDVFKAANEIISDQWLVDRITTRIAEPDTLKISELESQISELYAAMKLTSDDAQQKRLEREIEATKKKRNKIFLEAKIEAQAKLQELVGVKSQQMSWQLVMAKYPEFRSAIVDPLVQQVTSIYRKDYAEVVQGLKTVRRYKKGLPIPFRSTSLQFEKTDKGYAAHWLKGIKFGIRLGRDRSSRSNELDKILTGEYGYGDSAIQFKGTKMFLLLSLKHPDTTLKADKDKVLFVEAGIKIPVLAYLAKDDEPTTYGSADDILRFRMQLQTRRRKLQSSLKIASGGHGRKKKLAKLEDLGKLEQNWIRTYNHKLSRSVVNLAIRNRCGSIHLTEWSLNPEVESEDKIKFEDRNWAGHMLKQMIDYKCKLYGIELSLDKKVIDLGNVAEK